MTNINGYLDIIFNQELNGKSKQEKYKAIYDKIYYLCNEDIDKDNKEILKVLMERLKLIDLQYIKLNSMSKDFREQVVLRFIDDEIKRRSTTKVEKRAKTAVGVSICAITFSIIVPIGIELLKYYLKLQ